MRATTKTPSQDFEVPTTNPRGELATLKSDLSEDNYHKLPKFGLKRTEEQSKTRREEMKTLEA